MRLLGIFLTACVVLAAAQAAAAALAVLLLAALVYGFIVSPREMASMLIFLAILGVIEQHPLACLALATLVALAALIRRNL